MTSKDPARFKRLVRTISLNGLLLLVSLLFSAAAGEVAIRVAMPQQLIQLRPELWQPADTVGWLHRPNVNIEVNTGERTVSVRTDHAGFRVGEAGRVEHGARVLVLGDSFMEALQVEYEHSLAGLLQERLPQATGLPVAVRAGGIDGWSPSHYLLRTRMLLPQDTYRLVVVGIYVGNDAIATRFDRVPPRTETERFRFSMPASLSRAHITESLLRPFNDALEVRSHLYIFLRNRLETLRMRAGVSPLYMPSEFTRREAASERWEIIGSIAADLAEAARHHGAQALFVLIPAPFQVDEARWQQYLTGFQIDPAAVDLEQPTRLISEQLAARGLSFVDALPSFRLAHRNGRQLYGRVDPHLTPEGHAELANLVVPMASSLMAAPVND
jgi:hypothetical protein